MSRLFPSLHHASMQNNLADLVELLEGAADIDEVNMFGWTSLHFACAYFNVAPVDLLLRRGADIDIVNDDGRTALQLAMSRSDTYPNSVAVLQLMATYAQTRLEASSADWIHLARNERDRPQIVQNIF